MFKTRKTIQIIVNICNVFRIPQVFHSRVVLLLLTKGKPADMLVTPNIVKVSNHCSKIKEGFVMCISCLSDNHFHAQSNVEQPGEVLSTGGQIHPGAVDKGRPTVQQVTPFSYYAIRFRPKNVRWSQIR